MKNLTRGIIIICVVVGIGGVSSYLYFIDQQKQLQNKLGEMQNQTVASQKQQKEIVVQKMQQQDNASKKQLELEQQTFTKPSTLVTLDKFGILELHPTSAGGKEWWSNWSNGIERTVTVGNKDPYDSTGWFKVRGCCSGSTSPTVKIDGYGIAMMSGAQPRMYIYDPHFIQKWHDVEITIYGMRVGEYTNPPDSSAGINIAGRSNHQNENNSLCGVNTYYSRMLYNGIGNFAKELNHPDDSDVPSGKNQLDWSKYGGTDMPANVWVGHKMIIKNVDNGTHVRLEMWRDLTNGINGGNWQLMVNYTDTGNWYDPSTKGCTTTDLNHVITEPQSSIFIRNTGVFSVLYKGWSIREIS